MGMVKKSYRVYLPPDAKGTRSFDTITVTVMTKWGKKPEVCVEAKNYLHIVFAGEEAMW